MVKRKKVRFKTKYGNISFKAKIIDKKLSRHEILLRERKKGFIV